MENKLIAITKWSHRQWLQGMLSLFILACIHGCSKSDHTVSPGLSVESEKHLYKVEMQPLVKPVPVNQLHQWQITLSSPSNLPIQNAQIAIDGSMPEHDHGLPTAPVVHALGGGRYLVDGMKFSMPGQWRLMVMIKSPVGDDSAVLYPQINLPDVHN